MQLAATADRYFPQVLSIVRIMAALLLLQKRIGPSGQAQFRPTQVDHR